jgi:nucleoside-diphosphate-sugar epimerase
MILVTGGLGMIGAHTARALLDLGESVVVTQHRNADLPSFLAGPDGPSVERLDVTDREAFLDLGRRHEITGIVHLAGSGLAIAAQPIEFFRIETTGLLNALEAARAWGVRRFSVAGSIGAYIGRQETRWHEELALPTMTYDNPIVAFKRAVEPLTTDGLHGTGVEPVVLRIGTIWGRLGDPASPFIPIPSLINAIVRGTEPPTVHADDGGDRCYATDCGRAIALLMTTPTLRHDTYNVSSGRPVTNQEFADALAAAVPGAAIEVLPGRAAPGADPYLDISRLTADTGFTPAFDVATAVADYVDWLASNPR